MVADQKGAAGLKASSGTSRFHQGFFSGPLLNPIISLKPTPSKWDDSEKWITSPGHHESSSPATAASGHSHQQQLHHHHHQYHEPILTGVNHDTTTTNNPQGWFFLVCKFLLGHSSQP
jgi:hypothetical protein